MPFKPKDFDNVGYRAIYQNKVALELPIILVAFGNCSFSTKTRNV